MVKAKGIKDGKNIEVVYNDGGFLFDGEQDILYEIDIRNEMSKRHPIGGTYYVKDENDEINIINVLRSWFFDRPTLDIESDCTFELPYEEGVVY